MPIELGSFSLGSVAGGVIGALAGHYLTKSRNAEDREIKEFNAAAVQFRSAFAEEITRLKTRNRGTTPDAALILGIAFPKHLAAIDEFRNHLPTKDIPAFNKTWDEYDNGRKNGHYSDKFVDPHNVNPQEHQLVALERIGKLMEFAAPK